MTPVDHPCVIVGGGLAGMVAARRLQQLGIQAVVLEKSEEEGGFGNVVISGGLVHVAWEPPDSPVDVKRERLIAETGAEIEPELADVFASESSRIIPWLLAEGVDMRPKTEEPATKWTFHPFRSGAGRRLLPEIGGGRAMRRLYQNFRRAGGTIMLGAAADSLEPAGQGRWGLGYRLGAARESLVASSILFADGGFQANQEMLTRYVGPNAGRCLLRATTTGTGDGLRLLLGVGADAMGLGRLYGHLVSIGALESDELWPFPHLDELCLKGALVTRRGDLFPVDVGTAVALVTRLARTDDPRGFAAVFDSRLWEEAGAGAALGLPVPNPQLVQRGGHLARAESIGALATALGIEGERLEAAVGQHNRRPGSRQISDPPFYAARTIPGITFSMGGARIGPDAAVLDLGGRPLPGLFAAGSAAGGIHGGPDGGYVGGLAAAATFGHVAAAGIAARESAGGGAVLDKRNQAQ